MFIDKTEIFVKAGNGGHGSVAFRREKYVPNGGPAGGDGGKGGNIVLKIDTNLRTLLDFRYKRKHQAESGSNGEGSNRSGKDGQNLIIKVPPGTVIKDKETGRILADMVNVDQEIIIAKGGNGGRGNQHFSTSTRQAPRFAEGGQKGEEKTLVLELKLLADVGLLGFPNVGKSTFLSVVSKARPKIANYHFTTIVPNLGVVKWKNYNSFVIADIPGLIEGAHEGAGLGHQFLRHVERTKLLIHILDASGIEGRDAIEDFETINKELINYNKKLAKRKQVVALNKVDIISDKIQIEKMQEYFENKGFEVFSISAITKEGIDKLLNRVIELLDEIGEVEPIFDIVENKETVYQAEFNKGYTINKENQYYIIKGNFLERLINSVNFDDYDSVGYFQKMLRSKGIFDELEQMGIQDGDVVKIFDIEFEYFK